MEAIIEGYNFVTRKGNNMKSSRDNPRSRSFRCTDKVWAHFKLICFLNEVHIQDQLEDLICDYVEKNNTLFTGDKRRGRRFKRRKKDISRISS